jgi:phage-related protein
MEDIQIMSKALANALTQLSQEELSNFSHEKYELIIPETQITQVIDLELIASSALGIEDILGQIGGFIKSVVNSAASYIVSTISGIVDGIKSAVSGAVSSVKDAVSGLISSAVSAIKDSIGGAISSIVSNIGSKISDMWRGVTSSISSAVSSISSAISTVASGLSSAISSVGSSLGKAISDMLSSLSRAISTVASTLSDAIGKVGSSLSSALSSVASSILGTLGSIASSLSTAIGNVASTLSSAISKIGSGIMSALSSVGSSIMNALSGVASSFMNALSSIATGIMNALSGIATSLGNALASLASGIMSAISGVMNALASIGSSILNAISGFVKTIVEGISSISKLIVDVFSGIGKTILDVLSSVGKTLSDVFSTIAKGIMDTLIGIGKGITDLWNFLVDSFKGIVATVSAGFQFISQTFMGFVNAILHVGDLIRSSLEKIGELIWQQLPDWLKNAITLIQNFFTKDLPNFFNWLMDGLHSFFSNPLDWIQKNVIDPLATALSKLGEWIWSMLPDWLKSAITAIQDFFTKTVPDFFTKTIPDFINWLMQGFQDFIKDPLGWIQKNVVTPLWNGLVQFAKAIHDAIWSVLPDWLKNAISSLSDMIVGAATFITNLFKDPVKTLSDTFSQIFANIGKYIWDLLPDWFKDGLETVGTFLYNLALTVGKPLIDFITSWIKDPAGTTWRLLQEFGKALQQVGTWIWQGLQFLWSKIVEGIRAFISWIWQGLLDTASTFARLVMTAATTLGSIIFNAWRSIASTVLSLSNSFISALIGTAKAVAESIGGTITAIINEFIKPMGEQIAKPIEDYLQQLIEKLSKGEQTKGEFYEALGLMGLYTGSIVISQAASMGIWMGLHGLATFFDRFSWTTPIKIRVKAKGKGSPGGVGAEGGADAEASQLVPLVIRPGWMIRHLAKEFKRYPDTFGRALIYGSAIWMSQPMMRLASSLFRNMLPLELPSVSEMIEILRRNMPTDKFDQVLETNRQYLRLYGYNDKIIEWLTSKELTIEVTDRFGTTRKIPISLMYDLPSASDVATMMVRDIFASVEDFLELYQARGMHKDVGSLYYFLRFRYPPPERLWQFTMRGISKLLWVSLTEKERSDAAKEATAIGGFIPCDAVTLNEDPKALFSAFQTYMKWHDYARFSWIKGFTSDNQIMIDTLADIPMKIDQRWMIKWGIYELLSNKGVTYKSPIKDFATKLLEPSPASKVTMDITNFSRTLQATGLHPDWVPATAVAETMNALSEERTALRTGFIGLFKEGFYDITALEKMLGGFITASFNVAYFDTVSKSWTTGWVNTPVMFLPPERKLLELRALMDRSLDILREIQRDISVAYQEFIIWDYNEYKSKLSQVIDSINKFYASDYQAITGNPLPPELQLKFVEDYYRPYVDALRIWREVFTIRRVRMWTQRWLGWIMYRVAQGVVKKEDMDKLIKFVVERAKLTDYETQYMRDIMEIIYGMVGAEYLPTPSTMATLSEYMVLDSSLVQKVLVERRVPQEWMDVWLTYIRVRPIKPDAKQLLTTYIRAMRAGVVTKEDVDKYIASLPQFGFTPQEIELITKRVTLEEMIAESMEYVPTPSMLATMADYVSIPSSLIQRVFEVRKIPPEWQAIWSRYITVRPLVDDVRGLIASLLRTARRVAVPQGIISKVESYANMIGFTQTEREILDLRIELESMVENASEYIPTLSTLATMVEYLPEVRDYLPKVFMLRKIPPEWQAIWQKYLDVRPLVDDIRRYISRIEDLYARFMIKRDDFLKLFDEANKYLGFEKTELDFIFKAVEFERYRVAWSELIGSVERLVSLSEYSPKASTYALRKLYEMIDALPLSPADKQELKAMWEEYIKNRPVKSEARTYITQLINLYVDGLISDADFKKELQAMKQWGFSDNELMFYEAQAALRKMRKLRIPVGE